MSSKSRVWAVCLAWAVLSAVLAGPASAQVIKQTEDFLGGLSVVKEGFATSPAVRPIEELRGQLSPQVSDGWERFRIEAGGEWAAFVDQRNGRIEHAEGAGVPWVPGRGNSLGLDDLADHIGPRGEVDLGTLESIARAFLAEAGPLLGVDPASLLLNPGRSGQPSDYIWLVDFDVVRGNLPVEGARVVFRVNHGNLVQFGTESLPPAGAVAPPVLVSRDAALAAVSAYVGGLGADDHVLDAGSLHLIPTTALDARFAEGFAFGKGYGLATVWQVLFRRKGVIGTWQARVDAASGEVVEFYDVNDYGKATGGVYPDSFLFANETVRPMPFTNLSTGGFTNSAGLYTTPGGAFTSSLNGQFVRIVDTCGAISLAGNGSGDLLFGTSSGTDCTTPGVGGAGNTHSSRMQFYHVNRIKEVGRGWLPANAWLNAQLTVNVDLNQTCNAYWNGSTINFFRSGGGCGNTGEIAGVSLHEYGHGLDNNDGNGSPPENGTGETTGDFTAALATHSSCIGNGFRATNCAGYGDACTSCTGVRDIDWAKHASNAPHTVPNFTQVRCPQPSPFNPNYVGPCGRDAIARGVLTDKREGHCESYVSSETLWDLANRDLPNPGTGGAWSIVDRIWYLSRSTATSAFVCSTAVSPWTSNGCATGTYWRTMRLVDDDDGNLANGTPHGGALFAAFDRHGIACAADPGAMTTFAACSLPVVPTLTLGPSNNQVQVSWTSSGAGVVYDVYRNESGCNAGFIKIANDVSGTSFTDTAVANGFAYSYQVIAHPTGSEACAAPPSVCQSATPVPCTAPGAPIVAAASVPGDNQIQVSWSDGAPSATQFSVYRAIGSCAAPGPFAPIATGLAGSPYVDTTVSGSITYAYKVTGSEGTGVCESAFSGCVDATATGACIAPPAFAGLATVTNQAASTCSLQLSWAAGSPACSGPVTYNVYRSTDPNFIPAPANRIATGVAGTSFADNSGLTSGTTYTYVVRAVDASNGVEEANTVRRSGTPTGPIASSTITETFEGALSGGGFDNAGWTHNPIAGATDWVWSTAQAQTPTHSWFSDSLTTVSNRVLVSPSFGVLAGTTLTFWHTFAFETNANQDCFDAGTLEISTDGGTVWTVVPDAAFTAGGFNGTVSSAHMNPLGGKRAWCRGTVGAMTQVSVNLAAFAGMNAKLRWHEGDDNSLQATGWFVDSVTIANAGTAGTCSGAIDNDHDFFTVTPCRLLDTRNPDGPMGGPALQPSALRTFTLTGACGVPSSARALSVNITVTQPADAGDLRLFPGDIAAPLVSTINFSADQTRANNAVLGLAGDGSGTIKVQTDSNGTVHFILDVNGYFQ